MLTKTGADLQIDAVHIRAICDEIGERLRGMLRRSVGNDLPPRLRDLIQQLALLDDDVAPSLVPSLEDLTTIPQSLTDRRHETIAVPIL